MATLASNLDRARSAVWQAFPGTTVYWIGDAAHQAECSDHNPDARGIVHAIDVMLAAGTEQANAVVRGAVGRADLEYVIHDRTIWSRNSGWAARPYDGSNPHTDHVHISGKHGATGQNSATCTGYDTNAENDTTPWVFALPEVAMSDADIPDTHRLAGNGDTWGRAIIKGEDPAHFLGGVGAGTPATTPNVLHQKLDEIRANAKKAADAVGAPVPVTLSDADLDRLAAKVAALLPPLTAAPSAATIAEELATRLGNG